MCDAVHNCGHEKVAAHTARYVNRFGNAQALRSAVLKAAGGNASAVTVEQQPVAVATPAAMRIFVEYQLDGSTLNATQKEQVKGLMASAVKVLQKFLYAKTPVQGKLLAPAACDVSSGVTCTRYYPEFRNVVGADRTCGPAANINPNHIAANPVHG